MLDVAVHPSGRVLLSVAKDKRLKMWNLVNAKLIYKQKFDEGLFACRRKQNVDTILVNVMEHARAFA